MGLLKEVRKSIQQNHKEFNSGGPHLEQFAIIKESEIQRSIRISNFLSVDAVEM